MKNLTILLIILLSAGFFSFIPPENSNGISVSFQFTRSGEESPLIKMTLKVDGSFELRDLSVPGKDIRASGR